MEEDIEILSFLVVYEPIPVRLMSVTQAHQALLVQYFLCKQLLCCVRRVVEATPFGLVHTRPKLPQFFTLPTKGNTWGA